MFGLFHFPLNLKYTAFGLAYFFTLLFHFSVLFTYLFSFLFFVVAFSLFIHASNIYSLVFKWKISFRVGFRFFFFSRFSLCSQFSFLFVLLIFNCEHKQSNWIYSLIRSSLTPRKYWSSKWKEKVGKEKKKERKNKLCINRCINNIYLFEGVEWNQKINKKKRRKKSNEHKARNMWKPFLDHSNGNIEKLCCSVNFRWIFFDFVFTFFSFNFTWKLLFHYDFINVFLSRYTDQRKKKKQHKAIESHIKHIKWARVASTSNEYI